MPVDFVFNGAASNQSIADRLLSVNFDVGALRPWIGADGNSYMSVNRGGKQQVIRTNANATLRKDEWIMFDTAILRAAQARLRVVADLRGAGLTFNIPNGMGKTVLEYEKMSDINDASISMDGLRLGENDRPEFQAAYLPLPIIHKDFSFSARQIMTSRNGGSPLDTTMGELAGRKVAEMAEKLTLGKLDTYAYGGGTIYGMTNFAGRISKTITSPAATGWTPAIHLTEVLNMQALSRAAYHYGPWMLYYSTAWAQYLDNDFSSSYPNKTLRNRIREIDGISDVRTLDYLEDYEMVMLEMDAQTMRMVIGMDVVTLQWDEVGGLLKNFKVMTIIVPQLRADINSNTGIVVGAPA
jgi:uncharacterized linocin/CFP29 family protein